MRLGGRPSRTLILSVGILAGCATSTAAPSSRAALETAPSSGTVLEDEPRLRVQEAGLVGQVTGLAGWTDTGRWGIQGTDLGHTFWHDDELYMVFGDTYGEGGRGGADWRSNAIARLALPEAEGLADGLRIAGMVTRDDGMARELLPSLKQEGVETTVIPTNGISVNGRMYLHYMSVSRWQVPGHWEVRHSAFAYSDDDGETWRLPEEAVRPGGSGFEQVAMAEHGGHVYIFGIPEGRFGGVRLSRVEKGALLDLAAHQYWDGEGWSLQPTEAESLVPPPVGELSVAWNEAHGVWIMMYLDVERNAVVLRTAPELEGPWGEEQVVFTAEEHPGLYAPYILPLRDQGDDVYFTLSLWGPYNVFLARVTLAGGLELPERRATP